MLLRNSFPAQAYERCCGAAQCLPCYNGAAIAMFIIAPDDEGAVKAAQKLDGFDVEARHLDRKVHRVPCQGFDIYR
jgi:hypothetical protein